MTQIMADKSEPLAVARPIGNRVVGNNTDATYAPGTLRVTVAIRLCIKEISDLPKAQKKPLKLKEIPANIQSQIYP